MAEFAATIEREQMANRECEERLEGCIADINEQSDKFEDNLVNVELKTDYKISNIIDKINELKEFAGRKNLKIKELSSVVTEKETELSVVRKEVRSIVLYAFNFTVI